MFVRYGQAAMMAAILTVAGNTVWAQNSAPQKCCPAKAGGVYNPAKGCGITFSYTPVLSCCKDGKCCKDGECCSKSKKCEANCSCTKEKKCDCCKGDECGCDKCGCKKTACAGCPIMHKLAKRIGIIMIMPASMPLPAPCCMEAMGMLPHPPLPPPHVLMPPPLPPPVPFPHPAITVNQANAGSLMFGYGITPHCGNSGCISGITPAGPPTITACSMIATPTITATKIHISATPSSDQLEMHVSDETCIHCKKMTVTIGENEITVSRFDDHVRIRGEGLKATAGSVCTDGKDRLILEGDVVLHCKKDGQTVANVMKGEHIELSLSSGAMTIQRIGTATQFAPVRAPVVIEP